MCDVVGIRSRDWRLVTSVLAASKPVTKLCSVPTTSCNRERRSRDDDDVTAVGGACSASRVTWRRLDTVVVAVRVTSLMVVDRLLTRSVRHSLKHTHHQLQYPHPPGDRTVRSLRYFPIRAYGTRTLFCHTLLLTILLQIFQKFTCNSPVVISHAMMVIPGWSVRLHLDCIVSILLSDWHQDRLPWMTS